MLPLRETKMDKISDSDGVPAERLSSSSDNQVSKVQDNPHLEEDKKIEARNDPAPVRSAVNAGAGESETGSAPAATIKKRTWRKPKDKPKRPLSSYNLFFRKSLPFERPEPLSHISHRNFSRTTPQNTSVNVSFRVWPEKLLLKRSFKV
mmetsp:Transcript_10132/g.18129  ORF Transcript_10132/g.18129 Transcript_10132/m.18129 type:complete len:149 (-) Transcript_10132:1439-1885(-)